MYFHNARYKITAACIFILLRKPADIFAAADNDCLLVHQQFFNITLAVILITRFSELCQFEV